jgi:predicted phage terminase large subunit-like protein
MWLTITAQEKYTWEIHKYILESIAFEWTDKDEDKFCNTVVELYNKYKCSLIYIEQNNWWLILARMLKKRWLAVIVINSEKDKVTRLREFQWEFERWLIKFSSDSKKVWALENQLLAFPWWEHDDMVDSMVFSFTPFAWWEIRTF